MTKEDKKFLEEEIAQVKKALRSIGYQYNFWQQRASLSNKQDDMQQFANVTGTKRGTEEYVKYLEELLAK